MAGVLHTVVGKAPPSSGARAARLFADSDDQELVQHRLGIVMAIAATISASFWVLGLVVNAALLPARFWEIQLSVSKLSHVVIAAVMFALYRVCLGRPRSRAVLSAFDVGGLLALNALLAVMVGTQPAGLHGEGLVVAANVLIGALRAAIVPSPPRWTAIVTAVAALPLPFGAYAGVARDTTWVESSAPRSTFIAFVAAVCVAGVATSYVVARVVYGLRSEVKSAMRLGQYTLEEEIGRGGMGVVYRARHALLRRPTAIKLLAPDRAGAAAERRFEREVQITASLTHPNTIAIYDYGHTREGVFYYAMELLDGMSLEKLVDEHGAQPPGRVVHLLAQAASALAEAHAAGLIHRDVKPANVFLCERGGVPDFVKVLDFGLVKETAQTEPSLSTANLVAGTPLFMAPESITKPDAIDARVDLYALGGVAYFLVTGWPPFEGGNLVEICSHHLHTKPMPVSERLGRPVAEGLEALIAKCLSKSPDDRPASAAALAQELRALAREPALAWSEEQAREWWRANTVSRSE